MIVCLAFGLAFAILAARVYIGKSGGRPVTAADQTQAITTEETAETDFLLTRGTPKQAVALLDALADLAYEAGDNPGGRYLAKVIRTPAAAENRITLRGPTPAVTEIEQLLEQLETTDSPIAFDRGLLLSFENVSLTQLRTSANSLRSPARVMSYGPREVVLLWGTEDQLSLAQEMLTTSGP